MPSVPVSGRFKTAAELGRRARREASEKSTGQSMRRIFRIQTSTSGRSIALPIQTLRTGPCYIPFLVMRSNIVAMVRKTRPHGVSIVMAMTWAVAVFSGTKQHGSSSQ